MGLIFLYKRMVYAQVMISVLTFCMVEGNPAILLIAGALVALSWYVAEGPSGKPFSERFVLVGTIPAITMLAFDLKWNSGNVIVAIGHFIIWLEVLLLYTRKTNRDYGMLMVLSLLQIIGASIITASLLFAVMMTIYCGLSLVAVLLFQFKWTHDQIAEEYKLSSIRTPVPAVLPIITGQGYRWHFRLTAISLGLSCVAISAIVFLLLPRSGTPKFTLGDASNATGTQSGFADQIHLNSGSTINAVGRAPVLTMRVYENNQLVSDTKRSFLLRGSAMDLYNPLSSIWSRSGGNQPDVPFELPPTGLPLARLPAKTAMIKAEITLQLQTNNTLFTLEPVTFVDSTTLNKITFNALDQNLGTTLSEKDDSGIISYAVMNPITPSLNLYNTYLGRTAKMKKPLFSEKDGHYELGMPEDYATGWSHNVAGIRRWVENVLSQRGLKRDYKAVYTPKDELIVSVLADYLQNNFQYTLDNPVLPKNVDPIDNFLMARQKGHCELFAAGLAAACRSIGLRARVASGYMVSDYNRIGRYYVVRQSDAHAWTEVFIGPRGWVTFDSTPIAAVLQEHRAYWGKLGLLSDLFDYLQLTWGSTVVAYTRSGRNKLMEGALSSVREMSSQSNTWINKYIDKVKTKLDSWKLSRFTYGIIGTIALFIFLAILVLIHRMVVRTKRLSALQIDHLPRKERRQLATRLRFYLQMLDLLDRYGYIRPTWQSPFSFARELADTNPMRFDPVLALTEEFYEIRFGHRDLDTDRQQRIKAHLKQLEYTLMHPKD